MSAAAPSLSQRTATARRLGEHQMQLALDAATSTDPSFGKRAYTFIVEYVRQQQSPVPGETVTLAAQNAGIGAGRDARAFGAVYAKAIREGAISVVGYCARARGHGSFGGKLYAAGR